MAAAGGGGEDPVEVQKKANLAMMELSNMIAVPMSLHAVVRLNVPAAIWQSGTNSPLSAAEILPLLRPPPPPSTDPANLQRLLRLLASHGVFTEHLFPSGVRRFSLTPVGQTLVSAASSNGGGEDGPSYAAYVLQHHQDALVRAWPRLHEAVLDPAGPEPFARANGGTPAYAYYGGDGEANELMQRAMWGVSKPFMDTFLNGHAAAFAGVRTVVDVGGSSGDCLRAIMQRVPTVQRGVNFDLPEVVAKAPKYPGMTHVGGDMFKAIPAGDAIFMKVACRRTQAHSRIDRNRWACQKEVVRTNPIMTKTRAQNNSIDSARQSFRQEDLPSPSPMAEPSSSHPVVTTDIQQLVALIQKMKILTEVVHRLQQQQTQQQQPMVEEPAARIVPSRHSHRTPQRSPSPSSERRPARHFHHVEPPSSWHSHHTTQRQRWSPPPSCHYSDKKGKSLRTPSTSSSSSSKDFTPAFSQQQRLNVYECKFRKINCRFIPLQMDGLVSFNNFGIYTATSFSQCIVDEPILTRFKMS